MWLEVDLGDLEIEVSIVAFVVRLLGQYTCHLLTYNRQSIVSGNNN